MKKLLIISLLGSIIFSFNAAAQVDKPVAKSKTATSNATSNVSTPAVHEYQLKNGLRLIVKEDHRAPVVISQVWYKVGSSYEPNGITGISHALEHMMFRGSKKYPDGKLNQIISENGGQLNASTTEDYTDYYELLSADKLPIAFDLEADRMQNLLLDPAAFAKEIQVVMEERRMRTEDDPQALAYERFVAAVYVSSPYHHPVIGWMNDLQNMKIEDLRHWYETWYAPNNAILVVVGDVQPEQVYQEAEKYFGNIPSKNLPVLKPRQEVKPLGTKTVEVAAPAKLPFLMLGYNTPVLNTTTEKWKPYALLVLANILDGGDSSRLQTDLVRGKQIATSADAAYTPYDRIDNFIIFYGTPAAGHSVADLKQGFLDEIQRLQTQPVSAQELERVKAQVIAARVYQKDSIENQADEIGRLESVGLSWREADNAIKAIAAITPAQIQAVAKEYLVPERLTVGILKPLPITGKEPQQSPSSNLRESNVH